MNTERDIPRIVDTFLNNLFQYGILENFQEYIQCNDSQAIQGLFMAAYMEPSTIDDYIKHTRWDEEYDMTHLTDDNPLTSQILAITLSMKQSKIISHSTPLEATAKYCSMNIVKEYRYTCPHCGKRTVKSDQPVRNATCSKCENTVLFEDVSW